MSGFCSTLTLTPLASVVSVMLEPDFGYVVRFPHLPQTLAVTGADEVESELVLEEWTELVGTRPSVVDPSAASVVVHIEAEHDYSGLTGTWGTTECELTAGQHSRCVVWLRRNERFEVFGGTVRHELLHSLGLEHSDISGSATAAGANGRRLQRAVDVALVQFLYGEVSSGTGRLGVRRSWRRWLRRECAYR